MEVPPVHSPGARLKGPPPTMSVIGVKHPGASNSKVVPKASPTANPSKHPRNRSLLFISISPIHSLLSEIAIYERFYFRPFEANRPTDFPERDQSSSLPGFDRARGHA